MMIHIDLITGFLGSGKTTFIKMYARYFLDKGQKIGILENDFGAVNVDVMLLQELEEAGCGIETVAGACDKDCHFRRFKTKLIAMGMSGYDRVLIEPSGIFDVDEFFDSLHEPPLDQWYEIGNVIAIVDAGLEKELSKQSEYLLASQTANAGAVILSRTQLVPEQQINSIIARLDDAAAKFGCRRTFESSVIKKDWHSFTDEDFSEIAAVGYVNAGYVKAFTEAKDYGSLYFMNVPFSPEALQQTARKLLADPECGKVFRVKGFIPYEGGWLELNATKESIRLAPIKNGQAIIIVIGEDLHKEKVSTFFNQ